VAAKRRAQPPRARAAVVHLPRAPRIASARFLPSRRSIGVGLGLLAVAAGSYVAARQTSAFAVTGIQVSGAPADVQAQVRRTLGSLSGTSLLALDGSALVHRVEALPTVASATYDRSFPHTLSVTVVAETPVAVLRRGADAWLLSGRGRVVAPVEARTVLALPRIWVPTKTRIEPGAFLADDAGATAARALAVAARFPADIVAAAPSADELTFRLRSGLELRLGAPADVRLKLAVARRALALLPPGATYLDVSVPGRPVAGLASTGNPQVSSGG
jgi:cell division protein FtsQ